MITKVKNTSRENLGAYVKVLNESDFEYDLNLHFLRKINFVLLHNNNIISSKNNDNNGKKANLNVITISILIAT